MEPLASPILVTPELLRKYDRPGPRYTSYPTAVEFSSAYDASAYFALARGGIEASGRPALALRAPAVLRASLHFLRLQRGHHAASIGCREIPGLPASRDSRGGAAPAAAAQGRAVPLGRRHAHLSEPRADARPAAGRDRVLRHPAGRGGGDRGRSPRHQPRADRSPALDGLQPPVDGRAGFRSRRAGHHQPQPDGTARRANCSRTAAAPVSRRSISTSSTACRCRSRKPSRRPWIP